MKLNLKELRSVVDSTISEAKKKKDKAKKNEKVPAPPEYRYAEAFDFSAPLGAYNLYRSQGAVNWGPMTGPGPSIDDRVSVAKSAKMAESLISLAESIPENSEWFPVLAEARRVAAIGNSGSIWESIMHWYDFQSRGLGRKNEGKGPEGSKKEGNIDEKKSGKKARKK